MCRKYLNNPAEREGLYNEALEHADNEHFDTPRHMLDRNDFEHTVLRYIWDTRLDRLTENIPMTIDDDYYLSNESETVFNDTMWYDWIEDRTRGYYSNLRMWVDDYCGIYPHENPDIVKYLWDHYKVNVNKEILNEILGEEG